MAWVVSKLKFYAPHPYTRISCIYVCIKVRIFIHPYTNAKTIERNISPALTLIVFLSSSKRKFPTNVGFAAFIAAQSQAILISQFLPLRWWFKHGSGATEVGRGATVRRQGDESACTPSLPEFNIPFLPF